MAATPTPARTQPRERRGGRKVVPREEREQQMLEAASRLFTERGFAGVSMDEIAEEVGVTKPMLYAYFDSKEGLFVACIERAAAPMLDVVRAAIDPSDAPDAQLWSGLLAFFDFVDFNRDEWSIFFVEASGRGGAAAARIGELRREIRAALTTLLGQTAADAGISSELVSEIEAQAQALMGAVESVAEWWLRHPEEGSARLHALRLMNFAWMGYGDLLRGELWLPPAEDAARRG
jgi:AcrR family transcriptional regulator